MKLDKFPILCKGGLSRLNAPCRFLLLLKVGEEERNQMRKREELLEQIHGTQAGERGRCAFPQMQITKSARLAVLRANTKKNLNARKKKKKRNGSDVSPLAYGKKLSTSG